MIPSQRLGQKIRQLLHYRHVADNDAAFFDALLDEMVANVDMLALVVEDRIPA
jgi:hypothetical protein